MNIKILRSIGKTLLKEIPSVKKDSKTPIGIGASGDKTYRIDKVAEDLILSGLNASGEALTVISEEIGVIDIKGGGRKVLIDPIDGSRNAVSGIPFYCTSIAVVDGNTVGDIGLAYVVNLINGDEFWAERGDGAFLNEERISTQKDDIFYLLAYSPVSSTDIPRIGPILWNRERRCFGATALDLAYLATVRLCLRTLTPVSTSAVVCSSKAGEFTDMNGNI
jgi:myo-inositol-1(or 4)-monophosphatase